MSILATIALVVYAIIGTAIATLLVTDPTTNTSRFEAGCCVVFGILWPSLIVLGLGVLSYDWIKGKRDAKAETRRRRVREFIDILGELHLISHKTWTIAYRSIK